MFELRQQRRHASELLLCATYWSLGSQPHELDASIQQPQMGHACEWETSMMLRIRPELVGDYHPLAPVPFGRAFAPAHRAWITQERSEPGHIGQPHLASAEKGEILFRAFAGDAVRPAEASCRLGWSAVGRMKLVQSRRKNDSGGP